MKNGGTTVEIAADWVAAVDAGLTPAQQRELDAWLAADISHRAAFKRLEGQYRASDRLSDAAPTVEADDSSQTEADVAPMENSGQPRVKRHSIGGMIFIILFVAGAAIAYTEWWSPAYGSSRQAVETGISESRQLTLPDGSVVTLNAASSVEVAYARKERRLRLSKGEAFFSVAHDERRPFIVQAGPVAVRAVGTAFDLRCETDLVEVIVTQGLVQVDDTALGRTVFPQTEVLESPGFDEPVVAAGERAVVPLVKDTNGIAPDRTRCVVIRLTREEMAEHLAWRERISEDPSDATRP